MPPTGLESVYESLRNATSDVVDYVSDVAQTGTSYARSISELLNGAGQSSHSSTCPTTPCPRQQPCPQPPCPQSPCPQPPTPRPSACQPTCPPPPRPVCPPRPCPPPPPCPPCIPQPRPPCPPCPPCVQQTCPVVQAQVAPAPAPAPMAAAFAPAAAAAAVAVPEPVVEAHLPAVPIEMEPPLPDGSPIPTPPPAKLVVCGPCPPQCCFNRKVVLAGLRCVGGNFVRIGGLSGFTAVAMGAYAAHVFYTKQNSESPPDDICARKEVFDIANRYHFIHSLALMITPLYNCPVMTGTLLTLGIFIFCGSCYLHALTGNKEVRRATPYGGVLLIMAWLSMMF